MATPAAVLPTALGKRYHLLLSMQHEGVHVAKYYKCQICVYVMLTYW